MALEIPMKIEVKNNILHTEINEELVKKAISKLGAEYGTAEEILQKIKDKVVSWDGKSPFLKNVAFQLQNGLESALAGNTNALTSALKLNNLNQKILSQRPDSSNYSVAEIQKLNDKQALHSIQPNDEVTVMKKPLKNNGIPFHI